MSGIHPAAARGFGAAAAAYERARPGYPAEAVDYVVEAVRARDAGRRGTGARDAVAWDASARDGIEWDTHTRDAGVVVDLGAGTGKLTTALAARGVRCVAVEPVGAMCAALAAALPGIPVVQAAAEAMPLAGGIAAAVTVAQAFHWFRAREAMAEIHRVLRPGGRLALLWNVRDITVDWAAALAAIVAPYEKDVRIPRRGEWAARTAPVAGRPFALVGEREFPHAHLMTPEGLVERVASVSYIASLPSEERAHVARRVRDLTERHPVLRGKPTFPDPYVTEISIFERR